MSELLSWIMPEQASSVSPSVDLLMHFILVICLFFFVLVVAMGTYFVIRFRRRKGDKFTYQIDDNARLETAWTVIPSILLLIIFVWGFKVFMDLQVAPGNAMEVKVTGQKWFWTFGYPDGVVSTGEMVVPINQPVKVRLSSKDVIHSFYVPAFRVKQDALPSRYTSVWFTPTKLGEYAMYCTEYCGTSHSQMVANVKVVERHEYEAWLQEAGAGSDLPPEELGAKVYKKNACFTCHSLDGSPMPGPTWKGLWGSVRQFEDGTEAVVDENYIRESILEPMNKVVKGYPPVMPSYQGLLNEEQIDGVIAYIRSINEDGGE